MPAKNIVEVLFHCMLNRVNNPRNFSVNFTASPKVVAELAQAGIKRSEICASYIGYTGKKAHKFPTLPGLDISHYPDITKDYHEFLKSALVTINSNLGKNKILNAYKKCRILCKKLKTADEWDTKFSPNFPGRDINGKVQYAKFKDKIVSANFVSNYIYSELLFHLGFSESMAKSAAKIYSNGIVNIFFDKTTSLKALKFKDTPADQEAITIAYKDFKRGSHL